MEKSRSSEVQKSGSLEVQKSGSLEVQKFRSSEVQKSRSPVITIMIPLYQILMHLTELLNFRTSKLPDF